ncbi:hypothetical protein [Clostridium sp.]|uniref:hypothetical protein n=1 Tax=Clostridium sp. TaxID=1506 RepID=UPI003463C232
MRKNGSLTIILSLMLLTVNWIIFFYNQEIGLKIIWLWPVILIILGLEILINNRKDKRKRKFNFGILVVLVVLVVSEGLMHNVNVEEINRIIIEARLSIFPEKIDLEKSLDLGEIKEINIEANYADIKLNRSEDNKLIFKGQVESTESIVKEYENNLFYIENGKLNVDFRKFKGKKIKGDLYVPGGINLNINVNSGSIVNVDPLEDVAINAKGNYCSFDFRKISNLTLENSGGSIYIRDIKNSNIKSGSMDILMEGSIDVLNLQGEEGRVKGDIKKFSKLNINSNIGNIDISSKEKNFVVNGAIEEGYMTINDKKGFKEVIGKGGNEINIKLNRGNAHIKTKE